MAEIAATEIEPGLVGRAKIVVGSLTYGQEFEWLKAEAGKENERRARRDRGYGRGGYTTQDIEYYRPRGDDGPGKIGRVLSFTGEGDDRRARFAWLRDRTGVSHYSFEVDEEIPAAPKGES